MNAFLSQASYDAFHRFAEPDMPPSIESQAWNEMGGYWRSLMSGAYIVEIRPEIGSNYPHGYYTHSADANFAVQAATELFFQERAK